MSEESALQKVIQLSKYEAKLLFLRCQKEGYLKISQLLHISPSKIQADCGDLYEKLGLPRDLRKKEDQEKLRVYCDVINGFVSSIKEIEEGWPPEEYKPPKPEIYPPPDDSQNRRTGLIIGGVIIFLCIFCLVGYRIYRLIPNNIFERTPEPTLSPTYTTIPPSETSTVTQTPTNSPSPTDTLTPSITPTPTETPTPSDTPTWTNTPTITDTPTNTNTPTSTNTFTPTPVVLFSDNFDNGISDQWINITGNEDQVYAVGGALSASETSALFVEAPAWQNYIVEFDGDCRRQGSSMYRLCVVGIRVSNPSNFLGFWWNAGDHGWAIVDADRQSTAKIPNTLYKKKKQGFKSIRIIVEGETFRVFVDGSELPSFSHSEYTQGGVVLYIQSGSFVDNFKVEALP